MITIHLRYSKVEVADRQPKKQGHNVSFVAGDCATIDFVSTAL